MCMKPSSQMFELAKHKTAEFLDSCKNASKKVKNVVVVGSATIGAIASQAAVTVDSTTGAISGTLDMTSYYSALAIVIPVTVTLIVGRIIIRTIKGA